MKRYMSCFRIKFINGLQYRMAALAGLMTQFAWGFMLLLLYQSFYTAAPESFPMEFHQLAAYIWLQQAFLAMMASWYFEGDIFEMIRLGTVAYEMVRPVDLYGLWYAKAAASRVSKAALRSAPILVVAALLPGDFRLRPPEDLRAFGLFLLSFAGGFLTVIAFSMLAYVATFYTMSPSGVRMMFIVTSEILTGAIVPLPFMPQGLRRAIEMTPFGVMQNLPFRIYSGNITGVEMYGGIAAQLLWLPALFLLGRWWLSRALKRVVVQGG